MSSPTHPRRTILKGAAALAAAAPILWRESVAAAATPVGAQWIAYGPRPKNQMWISWSSGSAGGAAMRPAAPQIRWGHTASYGNTKPASVCQQVPIPTGPANEPAENTFYSRILLTGLIAGGNYHYQVSNDGVSWGPDTTFSTASSGTPNFGFTAFGDQASNAATAGQMAAMIRSLTPAFHLGSGDLAYATTAPTQYPDVAGFLPAQWDSYLNLIGPAAAESIPWMTSVGAHEIEPLDDHGYAGYVTRFPHDYDPTSGSPVVHDFTYGNVAVLHLDGNDLSGQEMVNTGYTGGAQTAWLKKKLSAYRADKSGIDFIIAVCNCCVYSSNTNHGSDGGLRDVWGPLFDHYKVDLVISGHVHAYERTHPIIAGKVVRSVSSGGTVNPTTDGTTYITAGGGGNTLYKGWYGATGGGDAGSSTPPKIWRNGVNSADSVTGYSAYRRAAWSCLKVHVTPPNSHGHTTMRVRALMPKQTDSAVTSIAAPTEMDSVTLARTRC